MRTACKMAMMTLMLLLGSRTGILAEDDGLKLFENWQANVTANVNLRRNPSLGSDVVVRLNTNDRVLIRGIKGDWFQVIAETGNNAHKGWVHGHYVRKAAPADQEPVVDAPAPMTQPSPVPAMPQPPAPAVVAPATMPTPVVATPAATPPPATAEVKPAPTSAPVAPAATPPAAVVAPVKSVATAAVVQTTPPPPAEPPPARPTDPKAGEPEKASALALETDREMEPEKDKSFEFAKDIDAEESLPEQAGLWDIARLSLRFTALMLAATAFWLTQKQVRLARSSTC